MERMASKSFAPTATLVITARSTAAPTEICGGAARPLGSQRKIIVDFFCLEMSELYGLTSDVSVC